MVSRTSGRCSFHNELDERLAKQLLCCVHLVSIVDMNKCLVTMRSMPRKIRMFRKGSVSKICCRVCGSANIWCNGCQLRTSRAGLNAECCNTGKLEHVN